MRLLMILLTLALAGATGAAALAPNGSAPDIARQHFERTNCHQAYDVLVAAAKGGTVGAEDRAWGKSYEDAAAAGTPCPAPPADLARRAINRTVENDASLAQIARYLKQNDAAAYFEGALAVLQGKTTKVQPAEGFAMLKKAAELGDAPAQYFLALLHIGGTFGGKQDYAAGLPLIEAAARSGHVDALFQAGNFYKEGIANKADKKKAFDYYRQAAERGHIYATYLAYHMVVDGEGTKKDLDLAYRLARNMADQGEVYGAVMAASSLLLRKDAVKHENEVLFWMDRAARDGDDRIKTEVGKFRPQVAAAFTKAKAPPEYVPRVRKACPMKTVCYVNQFSGLQRCTTNKDYWNDCDG